MRKFFKEFKAFIAKGNVFDLAVGMIIAAAFNKIVSSLVNDIIMPLITYVSGAKDLASLSIILRESVDKNGKIVLLTWNYGNFIQTVIDFLIIALSVFIMVKIVTSSRKKFKEFGELLEQETAKDAKEMRKEAKRIAKQEKRKFKEVLDELRKARLEEIKAQEEQKKQEEEAKKAADRKNNPTSEDLLKEIRDLLKENK